MYLLLITSLVCSYYIVLDTIFHCEKVNLIQIREVSLKIRTFTKVHDIKEALYSMFFKQNSAMIDDEEVLVELSAFTSTLTPRN